LACSITARAAISFRSVLATSRVRARLCGSVTSIR
jgi:hypothetical protein